MSHATTAAPDEDWTSHWFGSAERRLHGVLEAPGSLGAQVTMRFTKGVPFKVTRPLVEMMIRQGYFTDVEDELGPLSVTSFYLHEDSPGSPSDVGTLPVSGDSRRMPAPTPVALQLPCFGVVLLAACGATLAVRKGWWWRTAARNYVAPSSHSSCSGESDGPE